MPYSLVGHGHEREIEFQIGHRVFFMPHVAAFFRGLSVTVSVQLAEPRSRAQLQHCYDEAFGREPMVRLVEDAPLVRDVRERHHVAIGGLSVSDDGMHAVVVATLDNLLAGAATQALRNLNLALGYTENQGVLS
jgi:N-acetyl-gamma-glutamyl-phosphate reductase